MEEGCKSKQQDKSHYYQINRFSPEWSDRKSDEIDAYAQAIDGLPRHHLEVFEKRGWLVPFLFANDEML